MKVTIFFLKIFTTVSTGSKYFYYTALHVPTRKYLNTALNCFVRKSSEITSQKQINRNVDILFLICFCIMLTFRCHWKRKQHQTSSHEPPHNSKRNRTKIKEPSERKHITTIKNRHVNNITTVENHGSEKISDKSKHSRRWHRMRQFHKFKQKKDMESSRLRSKVIVILRNKENIDKSNRNRRRKNPIKILRYTKRSYRDKKDDHQVIVKETLIQLEYTKRGEDKELTLKLEKYRKI